MTHSLSNIHSEKRNYETIHKAAAVVIATACVMPVAADHEFSRGVSQGIVAAAEITEASGLAASWTNPHVLWTHNDSGDRPRIFAIDDTGRLLGTYEITGIRRRCDLEDIAIGPGPVQGVAYLYIGDIGDNTRVRPNITIFRIPEPAVYLSQHDAPSEQKLKGVEVLTLTYPDGSHNAEALLVDPISGDLIIATKQFGTTDLYRAHVDSLVDRKASSLEFVRSLSIGTAQMATAGDISRQGNEIILKGYGFARLWSRADGQTIGDALEGHPINIPFVSFPIERQGEAFCFDQFSTDYFTLSEGKNQPLYLYKRTSDDGGIVPTTLIDAGATWKFLAGGSVQDDAWRDGDFDDSAWPTRARTTDSEVDDQNRITTTWFRTSIHIDDTSQFSEIRMLLRTNDGAVVYLNGREIARVDLSADAKFDEAPMQSSRNLGDAWVAFTIDPTIVVHGSNTLAVEVHRTPEDDGKDHDGLPFDCQLLAFPATQ